MPTKTLTPAAKAFKKVKLKSISKLKHEADKWCSQWVRQSAAQEGIAECYTCGKVDGWKYLQAGHFISRNNSATRYDLDNLRVQCSGCNVWGRGKINIFTDNLLRDLGVERFQALLSRGRSTFQFTRPVLEAIIEDFKEKVKTLEQNG